MDWFTKQKAFVWIIIVLVVINITSLVLMWLERSPSHPSKNEETRGTDSFLKSELSLSDEQAEALIKSRDKFFDSKRKLDDEMWLRKNEIKNEGFKKNPDTLKVKNLSDEIGKIQSEIEQLAFKHFSELGIVLNDDQSEKIKKILDRGGKHPRGPGDKRPPGPPPFNRP